MDYNGMRLAHPGAVFGADAATAARTGRLLESDGVQNSWADFLSPDDVDALLGRDPKLAADYEAIANAARPTMRSAFAGLVDLASLADGSDPRGCDADS